MKIPTFRTQQLPNKFRVAKRSQKTRMNEYMEYIIKAVL